MEFLRNCKKNVVIISITSDIGTALAKKYSEKGYNVVGTYKSKGRLDELKKIPNCHFFYCDMLNKKSVDDFIKNYKKLDLNWNIFISCPGTQKPIGKFFNCNFNEWSDSVHINSIEQLRALHGLYPLRNQDKVSNVVFFAGGGTNNAFPNYSAYTVSKIMLIKMCELIDSEAEDLNVFIIGPGMTKTKMHYETLSEGREKSGEENYNKTAEFMGKEEGTSMEDIFGCIEWLCEKGRQTCGGRNFSVVYDKWGNDKLAETLMSNLNMYKLRRTGNEIKVE
ncbi:MAG: SDR family oxidoreductase [archaeon]